MLNNAAARGTGTGASRYVAFLAALAVLAVSAILLALVFVTRQGSSAFPDVGISAGGSLQSWRTADLDRQLDDYRSLHAHWIRHDFAWDAIEYRKGVFTWSGFDRLVSAARARGLHVLATVTYTPPWANGGHSDHGYKPTSADQFGRFAGEVAARYAPRGVHAHEIWNEPNVGFWQPVPDPAYYTSVLCAAYRSIHAVDPQAAAWAARAPVPHEFNHHDLRYASLIRRTCTAD